ncbi:MAG: hypothetical protein MUC65_03530 [Pontiellaceae bacterium]|nr:hypothetical protein [Pontiellaceae bacterium]
MVLLDALDQFEPTPRGRHLTWFKPPQWPSNARMIATGLPCPAGKVLSKSAGIEEVELPQLTAADAAGIGKQVWGLYHREINPAVLRVLIEKKLPDGKPACGNPLWLTLALEQLNLLDADDFARAERDFTGSPTERMTALLIDTAKRMPPDIGGLYGWLLEQNEKAFGAANTRGFATAIALSRSGWRETDLIALVPRLAPFFNQQSATETTSSWAPRERGNEVALNNQQFTDLGLATLRRGFRAHIVRRGENGQLDFFHAQMRRAMLDRCVPNEKTRQALHAAISDYLETLPAGDPLIRLERMGQPIGEHNTLRAGRYYATLKANAESATERLGATWALVDWIAEGESKDKENPNLAWITAWLDSAGLTSDEVYRLTYNFQFGLFIRMENDLGLRARLQLVAAARSALQRLSAADPSNAGWQRDLSVSYDRIGDVLRAQGDLAGALNAYRDSLAVAQRLAAADPSNAEWQRDLFISYAKFAQVSASTNPAESHQWWRKCYEQILSMKQRGILAPSDERLLAIAQQKAGM